VNDGGWHHVAAVLVNDGTPDASEIKLYVDGIPEIGTTSASRQIITASVENVKIGADKTGGGGYFNGRLDEVRIYERALSWVEIEVLGQPFYAPGLV